jgi:hypothetical protein
MEEIADRNIHQIIAKQEIKDLHVTSLTDSHNTRVLAQIVSIAQFFK